MKKKERKRKKERMQYRTIYITPHRVYFNFIHNGMLLTWLGRMFYEFLLWPFNMINFMNWTTALHYGSCLQVQACEGGNKQISAEGGPVSKRPNQNAKWEATFRK